MKTTLFTLAIMALSLTACSNEDSMYDGWDGRLHLNSDIAVLTRATYGLDDKIANTEKVWLYIDGTGAGTPQYYNKELTANGSNGFTISDGGEMFFPAQEAGINLYAFHINTTTARPDNYPSSSLTHKVEQTQNIAANYGKSDLLYSKTTKTKEEVKGASGTVKLTFKHLLSKIEVVLKKGTGMTAVNISKVEILNTKLEGSFTPSKSSDDITVTSAGSITSNNPIEIGTELTTSSAILNEAIIIPQTLADKTAFIRITLDNGGMLTYNLKSATTFAANTKYRYTITANLTGLTVTSEITDWTGDSNTDGDAEM